MNKTKNTANLPFLEKYRPKQLKDMVGNTNNLTQLQILVQTKSIPNLLLCGPPGIGKTTSVLAIAREILGEDQIKENVLELNASDDRGIDVVRDKIVNFAKAKVVGQQTKFIILDEADSMTTAAQEALRVIMTDQSDTVRFALACNDSSKVIGPIQSRCAIIRFSRMDDTNVMKRLLFIAQAESIQQDSQGLNALVWTAEGDMRAAINNLQSAQQAYGFVNEENVQNIVDCPNPREVDELLKLIWDEAFDASIKQIQNMLSNGTSTLDIVNNMQRNLERNSNFNQKQLENLKLILQKELTYSKMIIMEGNDSFLQVSSCIGKLINQISGYKKNVQNFESVKKVYNIK